MIGIAGLAETSQIPQHLAPDRDHAGEQNQRCQRGGFLNDGFQHAFLLRTETEHSSLSVLESSWSSGAVRIVQGPIAASLTNGFFRSVGGGPQCYGRRLR